MSDFWTDTKHRCLINFLVNYPKGMVFLKLEDVTNYVKDANLIVEWINEVISFVEKENIVSFEIDKGLNYKRAGDILEGHHPKLFWMPCVAHCLNLMLKDIGEQIDKIKLALANAKFVVGFIYNRGRVLGWLRKLTNGRDLHKSCVTRFASSFIHYEACGIIEYMLKFYLSPKCGEKVHYHRLKMAKEWKGL